MSKRTLESRIAAETGTRARDWEAFDGPETGVGVEYWFQHKDGRQAYVVDDQGEITISIGHKTDDGAA